MEIIFFGAYEHCVYKLRLHEQAQRNNDYDGEILTEVQIMNAHYRILPIQALSHRITLDKGWGRGLQERVLQ